MPLTADNVVQENSGATTVAGTSVNVTLPAGTTEGNTVLVAFSSDLTPSATGWTQDKVSGVAASVYRRSEVPASETSWTFTTGGNSFFTWYAVELSNVDTVEPMDASASSSASISNGGTLSTGTTPQSAGLSTMALAVFATSKSASDTHSWSGYTNGFGEVIEVDPGAGNGGSHLAVARIFLDGTTSTFETTGTFATTGSTVTGSSLMVVYRAADAPVAAPLALFAGFDWGTHGGLGTSGATSLMGAQLGAVGTFGTGYLIQASSARTSAYGLRIVQSGTQAYVLAGNLNAGSAAMVFDVRTVSGTGTVVVAEAVLTGSASHLALVYDTTTTKYGLRWGSGTVSWQSGTTALNTYVSVDLRLKVNTTVYHAEWRLETGADTYTEQTPPADLTGQLATTVGPLRMGDDSAQTVTVDFDNVCLSRYYVAYPLGPHVVSLQTVDPAGTPSVSGTAANFSVFTANGTLAAWNSANARNAVDEVPPNVSATADGVCQTATAASDYMQFPMTAPTVGNDEIVAGRRMLAAMWGGAGAGTGTFGLRGYDGSAETTLIAASTSYDAGSPTAISATEPLWQCAMWQQAPTWTPTQWANTSLRAGFSTDAAPDMGTHALYIETAVRKAQRATVIRTTDTATGDEFLVEILMHPYTSATVSYVVTNAAGRDSVLHWVLNGTPDSMSVSSAESPKTINIQAESFGDVSDVRLAIV